MYKCKKAHNVGVCIRFPF